MEGVNETGEQLRRGRGNRNSAQHENSVEPMLHGVPDSQRHRLAILLEQNDEWVGQHSGYMPIEGFATLGDALTVSLSAVAV